MSSDDNFTLKNNMSLFSGSGNRQLLVTGTNPNKKVLIDVNSLLSNKLNELKNSYNTGLVFKIEAIRLTYNLPSLPKSPYPNIGLTDNLPTRMAKNADIQANYPFVELNIYKRKQGSNKSDIIAIVPLQNKGVLGYADLLKPYLTTGEVKLLGEDDKIEVELNNNNQVLTAEDYLQIEVDYSFEISGVYRPSELERINNGYYKLFNIPGGIPLIREDGYINAALIPPQTNSNLNIDLNALTALAFIDAYFFLFSGGIWLLSTVGQETNARLPFYEYMANSLQHWKIQLRSGITSLANFNPNNLTALNLTTVPTLLDIEISGLTKYPNLTDLRLRAVNRNTVNFTNLIAGTSIDYLDCYDCSLSQAKIDEIIIAIDNRGITNGYLELRLNASPSPGLQALNNIAAKGWNYLIS